MQRTELASKLVAARTVRERKAMLAQHLMLADAELAYAIKDICYEYWTNEPSRARRAALAARTLADVAGGVELSAVALWVDGIAKITLGKLEDALRILDRSANLFRSLGKAHEAAQTKVAKLMALALMGRYGEAIETGRSARRVFVASGDDFGAGRVELNLSNLFSRREMHRQSEKYGTSARDRFAKIGSTRWKIMAENGLGITYTHLNDFRRARRSYEAALDAARGAGMFVTEAEIEASLGDLSAMIGNYADAVKYLESSRQKYRAIDIKHNNAVADLEIGASYLKLHLVPEALELLRRTAPALRKLKLRPEEARARVLFGMAAAQAGRLGLARRQFNLAARLYDEIGNRVGVALAAIEQAYLELGRNDFDTAYEFTRTAESKLRKSENQRHLLLPRLLRAQIALKQGRIKIAERRLRLLLADAERLRDPGVSLSALNALGDIAVAEGDLRAAERYFRNAIERTEATRNSLASDEFRIAFRASNSQPFESLLEIFVSTGRIREAFVLAERSRAQALWDAVRSSRDDESANAPKPLTERVSALREDLNWAYNRLAETTGQDRPKLEKRVLRLERELAGATRQIDSLATAYSPDRGAFSSADRDQLISQCGSGTTLVEFIKTGKTFSAFVISKRGIDLVQNISDEAEITRSLDALRFQFSSFRYGAKLPAATETHLKGKTDRELESLYKILLHPIIPYVEGNDIVIVPAGALNYVPFHALRNASGYVVDQYEIGYAPSAAVWQKLVSRPRRRPRNSLLIGYADEAIPFVEDEITAIQIYTARPRALLGVDATWEAFTEQASGFDLLHIACHGQFRQDNPMYSSLRLAGGWVTVNDICKQRLKASLVTLSACETGVSKIVAGEEIMGLARGFIAAGADSLVLSLWAVNDAATRELMSQFYAHLRTSTAGSALRSAQRKMSEQGRHPYFWAPFIKIGK